MIINNAEELNKAIYELEDKIALNQGELRNDFSELIEKLKPINLIKSTVNSIATTPEIRNNLINASIGLGAGLIAKKLVVGKSNSVFRKILGGIIEFGTANVIAKSSPEIKKGTRNIIQSLTNKNLVNRP